MNLLTSASTCGTHSSIIQRRCSAASPLYGAWPFHTPVRRPWRQLVVQPRTGLLTDTSTIGGQSFSPWQAFHTSSPLP